MRWSRDLVGTVWRVEGPGGWHFVTLPLDAAQEVRELFGGGVAWGSVRVEARVGRTSWRTSIFPDKARGSYLLPVKASVRESEGVREGDEIRFRLVIVP